MRPRALERPVDRSAWANAGPVVFSLTLFCSAALLCLLQPLVGKLILPLFGGGAAVWNTCLVFFQGALLAGYGYAYLSTRWLPIRRQTVLQALLLALGLILLPVAIPSDYFPGSSHPVPQLLKLLVLLVGLPFCIVASTAPLLQRWFSETGHVRAYDPYFLYAASNAGSLSALFVYPLLIEPSLTLRRQAEWWAAGYGCLILLVLACAIIARRSGSSDRNADGFDGRRLPPAKAETRGAAFVRRSTWLALAFVPSSLLMAVTAHLTADVAPIPLLWIMPFAVYLVSFIVAFGGAAAALRLPLRVLLPFTILLQCFFLSVEATKSLPTQVLVNLWTLLNVALVCHGELARRRPPARQLTEFYWWMSLGGFLGGAFNALAAPLIFDRLAEYPLVLVAASLLMRPLSSKTATRRDWILDVVLPLLLAALATFVLHRSSSTSFRENFIILALVCACFLKRPLRFGLGVAALLVVVEGLRLSGTPVVYRERNFYGTLSVWDIGRGYTLANGTTVHGAQYRVGDPLHDRPLGYYYPGGAAAQVLDALAAAKPSLRVAVVGLGTGSLAAYGRPGQQFTFFEIDPAVIELATSSEYFSYLRDSRAAISVVAGDARLSLAKVPDSSYDVVVLDAFSGDSIPTHLLTREAVRLYFDKLTAGGVLLVHFSNKYLDLGPVIARLAEATNVVQLAQDDTATPAELNVGKLPGNWAVLAQRRQDLGPLATDRRWQPLKPRPGDAVWTDDYSNLLSVLRGL